MTAALPFTVIGGYLGAGKTTLLNHLLTEARGLRVAALVNDFGSVNIDAELVRSHEGDTINLANGCMCCSLVNGFASAIGRIRNRAADFDHVVIEASGVADPARIAQYGQMYELPLDGIVVVADAEQVRTQAVNPYVGDTVLRQLAQADFIVLNKVDLVASDDVRRVRDWLAEQAPGTPIIETSHSTVPPDVLLGACSPRTETPKEIWRTHPQDHASTFESWTVEREQPLPRSALATFAARLGDGIYRAKGLVCVQEEPHRRHVYQQVGTRWSVEPGLEWGDDPRRTRVVVIGRAGATTSGALAALLGTPAPT